MGEPSSGTSPPAERSELRLDSWKEIAAYLNRDVTTVQRWEKREAMPVHRHQHDRMGSVYAFSSELDAWVQSRKFQLKEEGERRREPVEEVVYIPNGTPRVSRWLVLGGVVGLTLIFVTYLVIWNHERKLAQPKITSLAVLPLKNLSGDPTQEYFADGMT